LACATSHLGLFILAAGIIRALVFGTVRMGNKHMHVRGGQVGGDGMMSGWTGLAAYLEHILPVDTKRFRTCRIMVYGVPREFLGP